MAFAEIAETPQRHRLAFRPISHSTLFLLIQELTDTPLTLIQGE